MPDASRRVRLGAGVEKSVDREQADLAQVDWLRRLAVQAVVDAAASAAARVPYIRAAALSAARSCAGAERWAAARVAKPWAGPAQRAPLFVKAAELRKAPKSAMMVRSLAPKPGEL